MSNEPSTSESGYALPDIIMDEDESGKTRKHQSSKSENTILPDKCQICRNPAVGYHYDVATCNGCKAFFRRTVITGRLVKCKSGNKCLEGTEPIDSNKRLCGGCRFAKCEQMGMNPLSIRADITTKEGKILKEELVKKRRISDVSAIEKLNITDDLTEVLTKLTIIESQLEDLVNSKLPRHYVDLRPLSDIVVDNTTINVTQIPNLSFMGDQVIPDHAGLAHISFLAVVEFIKMMHFSRNLDSDSLLKVIKHGALMVRGLMNSERSIRKFNSDVIRRSDGSIAGKPMRNYNGIWVEQRKIVQKTLHAFLRSKIDHTEYLLLKAIVLSNPAILGLSKEAVQILEEERQKYARSLFTYCLKQNGVRYGPVRFGALISIMSVMENQQKEEKSFNVILRAFYSNAPVLVSPLYDEIMAS